MKQRILIVEDNEMNRDMLSRRLTRSDFEVSLACDGEEGVAMAPEKRAVAMELPVISGLTDDELAAARRAPSPRVAAGLSLIRMLLRTGSPLTSQGRMTERFTRPSFGKLQIDVTIDDPAAYTHPFTVRVNQQILADEELIEFICNENEKSVRHFD